MERRDLIKDQIEQLGKVLGHILAKFLGNKANGNVSEGIQLANEQFRNELNLDIDTITSLAGEDLKQYLKQNNLTAEHLDILARYFKEMGTALLHKNDAEAKIHLLKSKELFDLADEISQATSFERMSELSDINNLLKD